MFLMLILFILTCVIDELCFDARFVGFIFVKPYYHYRLIILRRRRAV